MPDLRAAGLVAAILLAAPRFALADEGGVSFWLSGQNGSFVALPATPGLSMPVLYYHSSVNADGSNLTPISGDVVANFGSSDDLLYIFPTYAFARSVARGQLSLTAGFGGGRNRVAGDVVAPAPGASQGFQSDTVWGISDLYPSAQLKWKHHEQHGMIYVNGGVPIGTYSDDDLASIGLNHWSIDAGAGYTFLDLKHGQEASAIAGVTYNFENNDTNYQNGIDSHLDIGFSQFVAEELFIGFSGYAYVQLTADHGSGAVLEDFKSRVFGAGPQAGYSFEVSEQKWTAMFKANFEFWAKDRPHGWNVFLSLVMPLVPAANP